VEIMQSPEVHDVIVVGSGASGGMAAYNLTQKGVKVLMLDAGAKFDRDKFWTHVLPFEADERLRRGESPPPFYLDKKEQPYLTPEGKLRVGAKVRIADMNEMCHLLHHIKEVAEIVGPQGPRHIVERNASRLNNLLAREKTVVGHQRPQAPGAAV